MDDAPPPAPPPDRSEPGRLTRETALAHLQRGSELLSSGDFAEAGQHFSRVVGFDDPAITASALLGLGEAHYRLNDEAAAVASWEAVLQLPETPSTYTAWRNVAAARVRDGDLRGAIAAYREADKRAPIEDKAEIANRLGWLTKETGDTRAAGKYFAKGRGDGPRITATLVLIAVTSVISLTAMLSSEGKFLYDLLQLDKPAVAAGEYWRLWTVTLLHSPEDPLHLIFNMYALYLAGTIVERWYGVGRFLAFYLACAAAGSTGSFVFGGDVPSVGAMLWATRIGPRLARGRTDPSSGRSAEPRRRQPADVPRDHQHRVRVRVGRADRQRGPSRRSRGRPLAGRPHPADGGADDVVALAQAGRTPGGRGPGDGACVCVRARHRGRRRGSRRGSRNRDGAAGCAYERAGHARRSQ